MTKALWKFIEEFHVLEIEQRSIRSLMTIEILLGQTEIVGPTKRSYKKEEKKIALECLAKYGIFCASFYQPRRSLLDFTQFKEDHSNECLSLLSKITGVEYWDDSEDEVEEDQDQRIEEDEEKIELAEYIDEDNNEDSSSVSGSKFQDELYIRDQIDDPLDELEEEEEEEEELYEEICLGPPDLDEFESVAAMFQMRIHPQIVRILSDAVISSHSGVDDKDLFLLSELMFDPIDFILAECFGAEINLSRKSIVTRLQNQIKDEMRALKKAYSKSSELRDLKQLLEKIMLDHTLVEIKFSNQNIVKVSKPEALNHLSKLGRCLLIDGNGYSTEGLPLNVYYIEQDTLREISTKVFKSSNPSRKMFLYLLNSAIEGTFKVKFFDGKIPSKLISPDIYKDFKGFKSALKVGLRNLGLTKDFHVQTPKTDRQYWYLETTLPIVEVKICH